MMGTGKSTVAHRLAAHLIGWPVIDTDEMVHAHYGQSPADFIMNHGESYFRDIEEKILDQLLINTVNKPHIIATGGGIVTRSNNIPKLKKLGTVILLQASADIIYARISAQTDVDRPLLHGEGPIAKIQKLIEEREPLYLACADHMIDTDRTPHNMLDEEIIRLIRSKPD